MIVPLQTLTSNFYRHGTNLQSYEQDQRATLDIVLINYICEDIFEFNILTFDLNFLVLFMKRNVDVALDVTKFNLQFRSRVQIYLYFFIICSHDLIKRETKVFLALLRKYTHLHTSRNTNGFNRILV